MIESQNKPCSASSVAGEPWPLLKGNLPVRVELSTCFPLELVWKDTHKVSKMKMWAEHMSTPWQHQTRVWSTGVLWYWAAPNPCVKDCSGKREALSRTLVKLRKIKAALLKETLPAHTPGFCPKLRCPASLRWDLGQCTDTVHKLRSRGTRGKYRGVCERSTHPAESSSATKSSVAMVLLSRAAYCRWAWLALSPTME